MASVKSGLSKQVKMGMSVNQSHSLMLYSSFTQGTEALPVSSLELTFPVILGTPSLSILTHSSTTLNLTQKIKMNPTKSRIQTACNLVCHESPKTETSHVKHVD